MSIFIIIINILCIAYMLTQRHRSPAIVWIVSLASLSGIAMALYPEITNDIARKLGVGRGADLLFYFWILISFFLIINVQLKLISVNQNMTEIVRALAIQNANPKNKSSQEHDNLSGHKG